MRAYEDAVFAAIFLAMALVFMFPLFLMAWALLR